METRQEKGRFQIEKLEERIAPVSVNLGNDSGQVTGKVDITTGGAAATGTITVTTPGTTQTINVPGGPA